MGQHERARRRPREAGRRAGRGRRPDAGLGAALGAGLGAAWALALLLAPAPASAEWVDWIAEGATGFEYNDNLNLSAFEDDEESDYAWRARGRAGRVFQVSEKTRLGLAAAFDSAVQFRFDGFNRVRVGGEASLSHKLGIGAEQPVLRITNFIGYQQYDSDWRSGLDYEAEVDVSRRFGPRLDGSLFARFHLREGGGNGVVLPNKPTDVYDQDNWELGFRANYLLWDQLLLSAGYRYRRGEFESACTPGNVGKVIAREGANLKAITVDDVFGGCVYRLGGDMHVASVNLNYGLGRRFSVDLGYEFRQGQADVLIYRNNIVSLAVLFRY